MDKVKVIFPSHIHHLCQIAAGFLLLRQQGWDVELVDEGKHPGHPYYDLPIAFAEYGGKRIAYDVWDGYQDRPDMRRAAAECDFYFKRSFDEARNQEVFGPDAGKIHPLGFNYHVTLPGSPLNEPLWKQLAKPLWGRAPDVYFTPQVFEGTPRQNREGTVKILFLTRLWEEDSQLDERANLERRQINESRIHIIRALKERYGEHFLGGVNDLPIARELAPELIVPARFTERKRYMKLLHESDICIGTIGLHESIGWKTGEYVAAAKAIVNERFHYQVPGNFAQGVNYLPFTTDEQCLEAVRLLAEDSRALDAMQQANARYYQDWLRPDALIRRTLEQVSAWTKAENSRL